MSNAERKAREFLQIADQYSLGSLVTETPHPKTQRLSQWATDDPAHAIEVLREIDVEVIRFVEKRAEQIAALGQAIEETLGDGNRVFLSGCGSTGRLSLTIERLWREQFKGSVESRSGRRRDEHPSDTRASGANAGDAESVAAFMAGGDLAIIKAIEDFEDHPEYGERQLTELGFSDGDLLLAITEGGETPFVIGTVETAAALSTRRPYFLYCNPDETLKRTVERSKRVLEDERIRKLNLTSGEQVLSGSTRMQASTVLQLAAGLALFHGSHEAAIREEAAALADALETLDLRPLADFVKAEADTYDHGDLVLYDTSDFAMVVVTDTTERAPTFSLAPFENFDDEAPVPSWAYLRIPEAPDASSAWRELLLREPRPLDWKGIAHVAGYRRMLGYDFSRNVYERRSRTATGREQHVFRIAGSEGGITFSFRDLEWTVPTEGLSELSQHTLLKILLNTHSTLVMGRLGRYESNVMLWVKPSNFKLIDRSARYVLHLLHQAGVDSVTYEQAVHECFRQMEAVSEGEPVVTKAYAALKARQGSTA